MSLRFIMRDGKKILQEKVRIVDSKDPLGMSSVEEWNDIPLVEELPPPPKEPRDFYIELNPDETMHRAFSITDHLGGIIKYSGKRPDYRKLVKVREVLDEK